jgi:hypothetical protein
MTPELKIIVRIKDQEADLVQGDRRLKTYVISSAANGLGCEAGSFKTPTGLLRIAKKIGDGCEAGTVFRARASTGERWSKDPSNPLANSRDDLVLTRILWLEGAELANANTLDRFIYLHGTNQEELLGKPVSHGCIRLSNVDIVDLFARVTEGTTVEVRE